MKRWILLASLVFLGAGCGDDYVSGVPSATSGSQGVVISGSSVGVSAIVAPDLKMMAGQSNMSFTLPF
ncbi:hypothetical protein A3E39_03845 [Candidatus Uhrbacteria bacterium RIFCSPHIGHO2_12_FULL_60_25]|uniref:Uncharacterized protein n=1 Tax=Candidatus Uhrbacteria bacterium RIFCSPHIGHO2_12_FULL_60_25 TaxID=1802399 RepID=A0A1F7UJ17_9BACT|nr:MAG: hypothetical protein A3D73_02020 [Candidatus Uhrbacteria bacterium RIFCSPHIGHO2_02_FULL_60_44]OGL78271.1 MAG: hypothetical protein A3E39_03845 [Candidatus Uhrbacteria bacterium RIFCSPHIGHO2_12_FULL_60_25]